MSTHSTHSPAELIWGASAIARVIGRTDRQTFHMLQNGQLPAKKIGDRWVAERGQLISFFTSQTALPPTEQRGAA